METITLQVPENIKRSLGTVSQDMELFIIQAIREKLQKTRKKSIDRLLAEGYKKTNDEDNQITKDFEIADFENLKCR
jgi:hypothetical protein